MNTIEHSVRQEKVSTKLAEIKAMNIPLFLEVSFAEAAEAILNAKNGEIEVKQVIVEHTDNEGCKISFVDDEKLPVEVELKLSYRNLPIGRCNCRKGVEHVRCGHLVTALHARMMLAKLKRLEPITVRSSCLWMPYQLQKT